MPYASIEARKQYLASYYMRNRAKLLARQQDYRAVNRDVVLAKKRAYFHKNAAKIKSKYKLYYATNKARVLASNKRWALNNRSKAYGYAAKWTKANPAKRRMYHRKWASTHPVAYRQNSAVNRARRRNAASVGDLSSIRRWAEKWQGQRSVQCYWCTRKVPPSDCHQDHIVPLSRGGQHSVGNLCVSCADCNQRKANKYPNVWNLTLEQPRLFL